MAQKQLKEQIETNEKAILGLKEMILDLCEGIENVTEEVQESTLSRQIEESGIS